MASAAEKLELSMKHLKKVQGAWDPLDWADLSMYGLYCLEAAVDAAAISFGVPLKAEHWSRVAAAQTLHTRHGLADVADLLRDLNAVRKSEAYGDVEAPELDAEQVAGQIESYVEAVAQALRSGDETQ